MMNDQCDFPSNDLSTSYTKNVKWSEQAEREETEEKIIRRNIQGQIITDRIVNDFWNNNFYYGTIFNFQSNPPLTQLDTTRETSHHYEKIFFSRISSELNKQLNITFNPTSWISYDRRNNNNRHIQRNYFAFFEKLIIYFFFQLTKDAISNLYHITRVIFIYSSNRILSKENRCNV